jgi:hypothetical protein
MKMLKYLLFISICIFGLSLSSVAQDRYVDVSNRIEYPEKGHVYVSPSTDSMIVWLINNGKDNLYAGDYVRLDPRLSNIFLNISTQRIEKDLLPGDSTLIRYVFQLKYSRAQPVIDLCSRISVYSLSSDLLKETDSTLANNEHCIEVAHAVNSSASISELATNQDVNVYPNPTMGKLMVETSLEIKNIYIYDLFGKQIEFHLSGNQIDLASCASGFYTISITSMDEKTFVKKVLLTQ